MALLCYFLIKFCLQINCFAKKQNEVIRHNNDIELNLFHNNQQSSYINPINYSKDETVDSTHYTNLSLDHTVDLNSIVVFRSNDN